MAQAVEYAWQRRATTQPGEQTPVSRHQCLDPGQQRLRITVLADIQAGHRTWRPCSQWPKRLTGRVLEVRHTRGSGRRGNHREEVCFMPLLHRVQREPMRGTASE